MGYVGTVLTMRTWQMHRVGTAPREDRRPRLLVADQGAALCPGGESHQTADADADADTQAQQAQQAQQQQQQQQGSSIELGES